jgi:hypothetical protein
VFTQLLAERNEYVMVTMDTGDLDQLREIMRLPRLPADATEADRLALLQEEAELRDQIVDYAYALDSADIDTVVSTHTEDCVITNPRGRYVGRDKIRANYVRYYKLFPWVRHIFGNIGIRFIDGLDEAYVTIGASHLAVNTPPDDIAEAGDSAFANSAYSTDIWRVVKMDGSWQIAERTIHYDPRLYQRLTLLEMD